MAAVGESPPDDEQAVDQKDPSFKENRQKGTSNAETEPRMLDEEEMPSYASLTSLPIPEESKTEENLIGEAEQTDPSQERASSPYASEQGADSVCVVSSGEESDQRRYEAMDDYDSEEMDMEEEEEEEDEEEGDSCINDEEEESEGDIEPEQFERSSDDFVLRYDSGLEKHHKERSRSLQDLTNSRGNLSRFVGKRRSTDLMGSHEPEFLRQSLHQNLEDPLQLRKKMPRSIKYDHVPSKVKLYIQEMKEQRRRSAERANRGMLAQKNINAHSYADETGVQAKQNSSSKTIKTYAQNAMNEVKKNERSNVIDDETYNDRRTNEEKVAFTSISKIHEIKEIDETEKTLPSDLSPQNRTRPSENTIKKLKSNGVVDYTESAGESAKNRDSNGPQEIARIFDVRSLNYEEYTNGIETSKGMIENLSLPKIRRDNEATGYTEQSFDPASETEVQALSSITKKDHEKVAQVVPMEVSQSRDNWNLRELTFDEPSRRKIAQVDSEVYQKTIEDNINLKRELDEMRKMFEQYRSDNPPGEAYQKIIAENTSLKLKLDGMRNEFDEYRVKNQPNETKVAAVQTEILSEGKTDTIEEATRALSTNKILSSTVTSALSSIEVWSDSNCSAAISIDPPNIEAALNSDDSTTIGERTMPKAPRPLSHSFVTSSRILQTLASITQKREKPASQSNVDIGRNNRQPNIEEQGQSKGQTFDDILCGNEEANSSRAKKRKASDMLDTSSNSESFKMPYTPGDARRKISSDCTADGARKEADQRSTNSDDRAKKKSNDDTKRGVDNSEDNDDCDTPANVKCFVYHDEPNSKERSFLIQTDDSGKDEETINRGGNVRECGPFLLGNVEIRMTETNGTINIWGKEINQSIDDNEVDVDMEDSETHENSFVPRSSFVCQSTPHHKCQNVKTSMCSSNKKARISPKFGRSGIGKYLRSAATSMSKTNSPNNTMNFERCTTPISDNNRTNNCQECESRQKRARLHSCENFVNSRMKQHACCANNIEMNERDYDSNKDNEIFDDPTLFESVSNILTNHREKCSNSMSKHVCCVNLVNEDIGRNQTIPCRHSNGCDQDFHSTKKRFSSCNNDSSPCSARLAPGCHNCHDNTNHSHNNISCDDEDQPLLSSGEHIETTETKRRRLSGKRVRGILTDLLRGCGGGSCRDPNSTSSLPRTNLQNLIPKIHVTPCSPMQSSSSKQMNSCSCQSNHNSKEIIDEKCCNSCTRRAEMRTQMENELQIFQEAMEQLRSRSDVVLGMLHLLKAEND